MHIYGFWFVPETLTRKFLFPHGQQCSGGQSPHEVAAYRKSIYRLHKLDRGRGATNHVPNTVTHMVLVDSLQFTYSRVYPSCRASYCTYNCNNCNKYLDQIKHFRIFCCDKKILIINPGFLFLIFGQLFGVAINNELIKH